MAFVWYQNTGRTTPVVISNILATSGTTYTYGQSLVVDDTTGRWVSAAAGAKVGGVYQGPTFTAGANDFLDVIEVTPNDAFIADYTGTPAATFLPGQQTADIAAGGVNLNAADVTGGAWAIIKVDTSNSKAYVRGKLRQFS